MQDEKYHTELVLHYVDEAVRLMGAKEGAAASDQLGEVRTKLQDLLSSSTHYQPQPVLARLQGTHLHVEMAAVFGRVSVGVLGVEVGGCEGVGVWVWVCRSGLE